MRNSGRPKREPYQCRRRRNLVVVAFRVKIGLSSSISAGCVGAFVFHVKESLWDRFEAPAVSPAGGRQSVMRAVRRAEVRARLVDSVHGPAACALGLLRCDSPARRNYGRLSVPRVAMCAPSGTGTHSVGGAIPKRACLGLPPILTALCGDLFRTWPRLRPRTTAALRRPRPSL